MEWKTLITELLQVEGWTKRRIARELGVSETIIYRLMRDNNIDLRSKNGDKLRELHHLETAKK